MGSLETVSPRGSRQTVNAALALMLVMTMGVAGTAASQESRPSTVKTTTDGPGWGRVLPPEPGPPMDPSLAAFLNELKAIAKRRDKRALLRLIPKDVDVEFGAAQGHAAFVASWGIDDPASGFWPELAWLLTIPGVLKRADVYSLPYAAYEYSADEPSLCGVIVRPRTIMRATASATGTPIVELSYDVVSYEPRPSAAAVTPKWTQIALKDGREGYVPARSVWVCVGMRIELYKENGRWIIGSFVGGN